MACWKAFADCDRRRFQKGFRVPVGDRGYPGMAYGGYLPGDEPGYYCSDTDQECDPEADTHRDKFDPENCPRLVKFIGKPCRECGEETLYLDIDSIQNVYCYSCCTEFDTDELIIKRTFEEFSASCDIKKKTVTLTITDKHSKDTLILKDSPESFIELAQSILDACAEHLQK